jgi:rhodanese-related sulfurtransferase
MGEDSSARAALRLIAAGYDQGQVAALAGGIRAWHQAGYAIVKWNDPPAPKS